MDKKGIMIRVVQDMDTFWFETWNEWLVIFSIIEHDYVSVSYRVHFLKPFSGDRVQLPVMRTNIVFPEDLFYCKLVLSSSTPLDSNCIFMSSMATGNKLAIYKQGDKEWKTVTTNQYQLKRYHYAKIFFYRTRAMFCALTTDNNLLVVRDIDSDEPRLLDLATRLTLNIETGILCVAALYWVELSSGDLLMVVRRKGTNFDKDRKSVGKYLFLIYTHSFDIYKLNLRRRVWAKVKSIGENAALFVGHYNMCNYLSTKDFPVKRDCIFFVARCDSNPGCVPDNDDANKCHDIQCSI